MVRFPNDSCSASALFDPTLAADPARAQRFEVIKTVERLEERLAHITTPLTSRSSAASSTARARRETDIGFTGGGNGTHQVYIGGLTDHRLKDADIVDHLVELVEQKAAEIEAEKQPEGDARLAAAQ